MSSLRSIGASFLAVSTWLAACGQVTDPKGSGCKKDGDCASGSACVVGACVPRIQGAPQTWALEVVPRSESPWAATENPAVTFTSDPAQLRVEGKTVVTGEIKEIDPMLTGASMRVVLSLASSIGKSERVFEAEARPGPDKSVLSFLINVPVSAVGRPARLTLFPAPPLDQSLPVWSFELPTLGPSIALEVPKSNEVWLIEGVLQDEMEQAKAGYVARALVGERLVSNVVKTNAQGRFQLRVPNAPVNGVSVDQVRVELAPADPMQVAPRIETTLMAMKLNLGVLRLPPVPKAQALDIPVTIQGRADRKLPGVTLRFSAELPNAFGGKALLVREYQTDKDGVAHVSLLPGNAGTTRDYAVTVLPPANSEFAARCHPAYSVATLPPGQARVGASIELGTKQELRGTVNDSGGAAQSGVIMTATLLGAADTQVCGVDKMVVPPPATVTTGLDGGYRLLLDPGRYRIEYEPPMGSATTLFLEENVLVDRSLQRSKIVLPSGVVATGLVKDSHGEGVMGAEVRIFGTPRAGRAPELRARTRTTADGAFMIVLPQVP